MNKKEASFILANIDRRVCDDELNEALDMAIKALEQEPCEDAVSRQYLIDIATEDGAYDYVSAQEIANAPSVNPQPKTGHWIKTSSGFKCSKCLIVHSHTSLFCQSCGARMVEPQESERTL